MATYLTQYVSYMVLTHHSNHAGKKKNTDLKYLLDRYKPDLVILSMGAPGFFHAQEKYFLKSVSFGS